MDFFNLDFGKKVEEIKYYYTEIEKRHPLNDADIRNYDKDLLNIKDNTKIDGLMQDEKYILHRKYEIREWLKIKEEYECYDFAHDNICIINFRGGEYVRHKDLYLTKKYWSDAVNNMLKINKDFKFIVITDDTYSAKKFFPDFDVYHFNIGKDYAIIKNAHYLILSNSSFAWFPAWLATNLKYCIAPKYWARYNVSDGYWSLGQNITSSFIYQDRNGKLYDYDTCISEFNEYQKGHPEYFISDSQIKKFNRFNIALFLKKEIGKLLPNKVKNFVYKFVIIKKR